MTEKKKEAKGEIQLTIMWDDVRKDKVQEALKSLVNNLVEQYPSIRAKATHIELSLTDWPKDVEKTGLIKLDEPDFEDGEESFSKVASFTGHFPVYLFTDAESKKDFEDVWGKRKDATGKTMFSVGRISWDKELEVYLSIA